MPVNLDKPEQWDADIAQSVGMYNAWFMEFAPAAFRRVRVQAASDVEAALAATRNLMHIKPALLREHPEILPALRMCTCPPLAMDRLIGLACVSLNLVQSMEQEKKLPPRMNAAAADAELAKIADIIERMADRAVFVWLGREAPPTGIEIQRAAAVVTDRLTEAIANPLVRNAQEQRQLGVIQAWLTARGYRQLPNGEGMKFNEMPPGTFSFRINVPVKLTSNVKKVNVPVDACIMPQSARAGDLPLFFEAKSAGDVTNTNKRQKEEATKMSQLRSTYGNDVRFNLFLCGYFGPRYLNYEAAEGIDWVWEHRIDDFALFGI